MRTRFDAGAPGLLRAVTVSLLLVAIAAFGHAATALANAPGDQYHATVDLKVPSPDLFSRMIQQHQPSPDAACLLTVLPNNGGTSGNGRAPSSNWRYIRSVYLITAAEMAAAGFPSGAQPTTIGWNYQTGSGTVASAPLIVYMQNTTDVTNNKSTTWATAITGMTVVHTATTALPSTTGPFDITLTGAPPFTYTGGGLYIAFDWGQYAGPFTTTAVIYCNTALTGGLKGAQTTTTTVPTTIAASNFRPETRLTPSTSPIVNDVSVDYVMAMGEQPLNLAGPQAVQAVITNRGQNPVTDQPVSLTVSGVDSYSFSGTISGTIAACGGGVVVTFPTYNLTALGSDVVQVSVPADDVPANNSVSRPMNITRSRDSYKYPGTTASGGVGLTGTTGVLVAKFTTTAPTFVKAVNLEFNTATADTYKVAIYPDAGGLPGTVPLYVDATNRIGPVGGPVTITLPAPVAVTSPFYVGIQQTGTANASLSYDTEIPVRSGSFFGATPLPVTSWFDFSPGNNFKLNIGVTLDQPPVVTLIAPNGGEDWEAGDVHQITWTATDDAVTAIDLAYSTDGGATYPFSIATGLSNSGSFDWTVPDIDTDSARVQVTAHDDGPTDFTAVDASDANVKIHRRTGVATAEGLLKTSNGLVVYPSPAGAQGTHVLYRLANAHVGEVAIYEVSGRLVRRLASGQTSAGVHSVDWDGADQSGHAVAAGVYMVRFQATDGMTMTHRFVLQK